MKTFRWIYIGVWIWNAGYSQIITTVAGTGTSGYSGDGGLAVNAQMAVLVGVSFDRIGNYYVADGGNNSCAIRKINANDSIYPYAGTGTWAYNGDGIPADSANIAPINVAFDSKGNGIISDQTNYRIRKVDKFGIITTICGTGTGGNSGDGGPAIYAEINCAGAVMVDKHDNIYIPDCSNHNVRKIDTNGIITTIAGTGVAGYSGDNGPATGAQLNGPYSITMDAIGNFYISDQLNHRIRKIDTAGIITTIAGTGTAGYSGDGNSASMAQLDHPAQLALDIAGNIFFADYYNSVVRKISPSGLITTIAGNGTIGYSGDNGLATNAQLKHAWGIALNSTGDLYITDQGNHVVRKVTNVGVMGVGQTKKENALAKLYPNPVSEILNIESKGLTEVKLYDILGSNVFTSKEKKLDVRELENGVYLARVKTSEGVFTQKVIVQH